MIKYLQSLRFQMLDKTSGGSLEMRLIVPAGCSLSDPFNQAALGQDRSFSTPKSLRRLLQNTAAAPFEYSSCSYTCSSQADSL